MLHSIFVRNLKPYTSQMSSQVPKWNKKEKNRKAESLKTIWKWGHPRSISECIGGQFSYICYTGTMTCMVYMYGSWTILKTIWNEVTKPKLSPWQLYHIMQYLLNEDAPQVVFLPQGNWYWTKHQNPRTKPKNKLNDVLKIKTILGSSYLYLFQVLVCSFQKFCCVLSSFSD